MTCTSIFDMIDYYSITAKCSNNTLPRKYPCLHWLIFTCSQQCTSIIKPYYKYTVILKTKGS